MKFRKKPVVIDAIQWSGENFDEVKLLGKGIFVNTTDPSSLTIQTLEGVMQAIKGDWIIKGVKGETYPCKDDIFKMTYEPDNIRVV